MSNIECIERLKQICALYTDILGTVILFGSYSRNEENENSDIDLYIEPADKIMTTAEFGKNKRYKEFKFALYDNFEKEFDLLTYGGKRDINSVKISPLWKQIEKDGIVLYDQRTIADMYTHWEAECRYFPVKVVRKESIRNAYNAVVRWIE